MVTKIWNRSMRIGHQWPWAVRPSPSKTESVLWKFRTTTESVPWRFRSYNPKHLLRAKITDCSEESSLLLTTSTRARKVGLEAFYGHLPFRIITVVLTITCWATKKSMLRMEAVIASRWNSEFSTWETPTNTCKLIKISCIMPIMWCARWILTSYNEKQQRERNRYGWLNDESLRRLSFCTIDR